MTPWLKRRQLKRLRQLQVADNFDLMEMFCPAPPPLPNLDAMINELKVRVCAGLGLPREFLNDTA